MPEIEPWKLVGVVYSAGTVFDGLRTGRLDTENFLRSGSLEGIASRADLALLEDLRALSMFVVSRLGASIDASYVRALNGQITRSGPLHPGRFRTAEQNIGVNTPYGRHEPDTLIDADLQRLIDRATGSADAIDSAIQLFIDIARAQPFEDGNKRTALFAANALLLGSRRPTLLTVPVDGEDPSVAARFNDLLARAYIFGEDEGIRELLRSEGITELVD